RSLDLSVTNLTGLSPIRSEPLSTSAEAAPGKNQPFRFRFSGSDYALAFEVHERDPDARKVAWENFKLVAQVKGDVASFVLTGNAVVKHPEGGALWVLSGE